MLISPCIWGAGKKAAIHVMVDQPTVRLSPRLYGLFLEDINFAADGGLYAELVQNRSFEYYSVEGWNPLSEGYEALTAWEKVERGDGRCRLSVERSIPLHRNNPHYLVIHIETPGRAVGVRNTGYDGIRVDRGERYDLSFYARRSGRQEGGAITVALEGKDGSNYGSTVIERIARDWQRYEGVIQADRTDDEAQLVLTTNGGDVLHLDMISLFPQKTFKGRKNGLRADLAQALADLKPAFFRFPGGCIAHGHSLQNAYRWKDTVGDVARRRPNWNRWGYHQTYGLGYYEYFLLSEDIGATPLPVLPVGVSCGFNQPYQCVPLDELQPWIDDCIDLIEFANGPSDSEWGKLRADMGHPEPFGLEYICLGNEEHDTPECRERFALFVEAIRKACPDIKIIGTSGLGPSIPLYPFMEELEVYSSDEHYYESPEWYLRHQNRFDDFDRSGPKVFVGEYASRGNTLFNAVAEAAYLTGIERNGDIVDMTCYAPLFAHVDHTQWTAANLIWFDRRTVVKTPNYYVQQLFSHHKGDVYLQNEVVETQEAHQTPTLRGAVGVGTWSTSMEVERALVNGAAQNFQDWKVQRGDFHLDNGRYAQRDTRLQPSMSVSPRIHQAYTVTYTVRARKTGGQEGFLLVFGYEDEDNYYWWNVGGWNNSQHAIERVSDGQKSVLIQGRGRIRPDTWYDLKVTLSPGRIRCYLNEALIHDYRDVGFGISVSSSLDRAKNEVILKLINPSDQEVEAAIHLTGAPSVASPARVVTLTGQGSDRNSLTHPEQVLPVSREITVDRRFKHTLPAISVQVIRVQVE
jgi:alpha-L-arabinofuranosidase